MHQPHCAVSRQGSSVRNPIGAIAIE